MVTAGLPHSLRGPAALVKIVPAIVVFLILTAIILLRTIRTRLFTPFLKGIPKP